MSEKPKEYNPLLDPALKKHFANKAWARSVVKMGLMTATHEVPVTDNAGVRRRAVETLRQAYDRQAKAAEEAERAAFQRKEEERLEAERKAYLLNFKRAQQEFRSHRDAVITQALAARKPVAASDPTEREKIFLEEQRMKAEDYKQVRPRRDLVLRGCVCVCSSPLLTPPVACARARGNGPARRARSGGQSWTR